MNISDNIGKIFWSFADKVTYILFGLFLLYQLKFVTPENLAYYQSTVLFNNWIFMIADGLALTGIIQFGFKKEMKYQANLYSLLIIIVFSLIASFIIFLLRDSLGNLFNSNEFSLSLFYLPLLSLLTIPRNYAIKLLYRDFNYQRVFTVNFIFFAAQVVFTLFIVSEKGALEFQDLINILIVGSICSSLISIILVINKLKFSFTGELSFKKYLKFGLTITNQQIFHSIPKIFDFHLISIFFGATVAGIYGAAKTLFKTFDEAISAAHGLIYPSAVKQIALKNFVGLKNLITKSTSALFLSFLFLTILLNLGLTDYLLNKFGLTNYLLSGFHFNLLIIGGLALPFALLAPTMNAMGKENLVLRFKFLSFIIFCITFLLIGNLGNPNLISLGLISYNLSLGLLCYLYVKKELNLKIMDLFIMIKDIKNKLIK